MEKGDDTTRDDTIRDGEKLRRRIMGGNWIGGDWIRKETIGNGEELKRQDIGYGRMRAEKEKI